jgi:hypothetical protein
MPATVSSRVPPAASARAVSMATVRGVSTAPGLTALTRTPSVIPRSANTLVNASRAALSGPVIANASRGVRAPMPPMLTTEPRAAARYGHAARIIQRAEHLHLERLDPLVVGE